MDIIHLISIFFEAVTSIFGLKLAIEKKKNYGWLIAFTFFIYVFYDIVRYLSVETSKEILYISFFAASASILYAVWQIYKKAK